MGKFFFCYAHEDNESDDKNERWLDRILKHMAPLVQQNLISTWSDKELKAGNRWNQKIEAAIDDAIAGVLIVSPSFLASNYIRESELPRLLAHAEVKGVEIISLIVRPCMYKIAEFKYPDAVKGPRILRLDDIQAINDPSRPLTSLKQYDQDKVLNDLGNRLLEIAKAHP